MIRKILHWTYLFFHRCRYEEHQIGQNLYQDVCSVCGHAKDPYFAEYVGPFTIEVQMCKHKGKVTGV